MDAASALIRSTSSWMAVRSAIFSERALTIDAFNLFLMAWVGLLFTFAFCCASRAVRLCSACLSFWACFFFLSMALSLAIVTALFSPIFFNNVVPCKSLRSSFTCWSVTIWSSWGTPCGRKEHFPKGSACGIINSIMSSIASGPPGTSLRTRMRDSALRHTFLTVLAKFGVVKSPYSKNEASNASQRVLSFQGPELIVTSSAAFFCQTRT